MGICLDSFYRFSIFNRPTKFFLSQKGVTEEAILPFKPRIKTLAIGEEKGRKRIVSLLKRKFRTHKKRHLFLSRTFGTCETVMLHALKLALLFSSLGHLKDAEHYLGLVTKWIFTMKEINCEIAAGNLSIAFNFLTFYPLPVIFFIKANMALLGEKEDSSSQNKAEIFSMISLEFMARCSSFLPHKEKESHDFRALKNLYRFLLKSLSIT